MQKPKKKAKKDMPMKKPAMPMQAGRMPMAMVPDPRKGGKRC